MFVIRNGRRWRDAPPDYSPHKTLYNRFIRWSRLGVFDRIFAGLAGEAGQPDRLRRMAAGSGIKTADDWSRAKQESH